jgi:hypothetical protein
MVIVQDASNLPRSQGETHHLLATSLPDLLLRRAHFLPRLKKREFANRLRDVPSCELSQTRRGGVPSLHVLAIQRLAIRFGLQIRLACLLRKVCLTAFNDASKQKELL